MTLPFATPEADEPVAEVKARSRTLLQVINLRKDFGDFRAVDDLSFTVSEGEVVGLLGANGAGKSTTIHMLLGLILPTAGTILLFGKDILHHHEEVFGAINFTSPYAGFPGRLSAYENLMVYAGLYGVRKRRAKVHELLELFGIASLARKPVAQFSSGEVARLRLCKAFLNDPKLLFLDEPTANLDPLAAAQVKKILVERQQRDGTAILLTSHNMTEVEELCRRVLFMSGGRIVADGTPVEVTRKFLNEDRAEPALTDVFIRIGER